MLEDARKELSDVSVAVDDAMEYVAGFSIEPFLGLVHLLDKLIPRELPKDSLTNLVVIDFLIQGD